MKLSKIGVVSFAAIGCLMVAGCASPVDPEVGDESASVTVDSMAFERLAGGTEMRVERAAGAAAFSLVGAPSWKQLAPGVWEDGESGTRIAVGDEGHGWLAAQVEKEIEEIYAHEDVTQASVLQKIAGLEKTLQEAHDAVALSPELPTPYAVTCNFALYTGPSGAVTSPAVAGAAALAQVVCTGGCATFTVTSRACCAGLCTPTTAVSRSVCSTAWTAGSIYGGSGAGYATVNLTPPNITQTNSAFTCQ